MRPIPAPVAVAYDAFPPAARAKLLELRALVFRTAADTPGVGPLREALRWGEPAFLTAPGVGSTVRLAWKPRRPEMVGVYFVCRTGLVDRFRDMFPTSLEYEGDRTILLEIAAATPEPELQACLRAALTYRLARKRPVASSAA